MVLTSPNCSSLHSNAPISRLHCRWTNPRMQRVQEFFAFLLNRWLQGQLWSWSTCGPCAKVKANLHQSQGSSNLCAASKRTRCATLNPYLRDVYSRLVMSTTVTYSYTGCQAHSCGLLSLVYGLVATPAVSHIDTTADRPAADQSSTQVTMSVIHST